MVAVDASLTWDNADFVRPFEPEQRLWIGVMTLAVSDARSRTYREEIAYWLGSWDFRCVCDFAGVDPDDAEAAFERLLTNPRKPNGPSERASHAIRESVALAREMLDQGYRQSEIADLMNVSRATLGYRLRKHEAASC